MADQKVREMEPVETQIVEIMPPDVENLIYVVRNKQVMVDSDLAMLYQVETGALNRAVKRNIARFPEDFRFQLTKDEYENLKCQFGTSNGSGTENGYGGRRTLPYVFTEQGISMLASVLHSEVAINVTVRCPVLRQCRCNRHIHSVPYLLSQMLSHQRKLHSVLPVRFHYRKL